MNRDINPLPKCFDGLPDEICEVESEICWSNFDEVDDNELAFYYLAEELIRTNNQKFKLNELYDDSVVKRLHILCLSILNVYYPLGEINKWIENPDLNPVPYEPIESSKAQLVLALVKVMLETSTSLEFIDAYIPDITTKGVILERTLGHVHKVGVKTITSAKRGGQKGGKQTPEEIAIKKQFVIQQYNKLMEKNPKLSIHSAARNILKLDKSEWENAGIIVKESVLNIIKITSIRNYISEYLKKQK